MHSGQPGGRLTADGGVGLSVCACVRVSEHMDLNLVSDSLPPVALS